MEGSRFWILLVRLSFLGITAIEQRQMATKNFQILNSTGKAHQLEFNLLELLAQLKQEIGFENILSFHNESHQEDCVWPDLLKSLNTPVLLVARGAAWGYERGWQYNKQVLVLHCATMLLGSVGSDGLDDGVLQGGLTLRALHHVVYVHVFPVNETEQRALLATYCRCAFKALLYKILLILPDFGHTQRYFQCRLYPLEAKYPYSSKQLLNGNSKKHFIVASSIFDEQFYDMHGATIWTQPDQHAPHVMLRMDSDDPTHMIGYIGSLITLYAQRRNATLRYRYPVVFRNVTHPSVIWKLVHNGSVDIGATLSSPISCYIEENTYTYDLVKYCFMMPLPSRLPIKLVPLSIISVPVFFIILLYMFIYGCLLLYSIIGSWHRLTYVNLFIYLDMVRAMLAQSYIMVPRPRMTTKFIYFLISFSCFVVANMYQAFLQSFLTQPPLLPRIVDYVEASKMGLKILLASQEYPLLIAIRGELPSYISNMLLLINNYTEFDRLRNSLNTRYIYAVTSRRWLVFAEQQKLFRRPVYFFSESLCIHDVIPVTLPIRVDLPYRELLDEFILKVQAVGLLEYWSSWHFYHMVRLNILTTDDLSVVENTGEAITMNDLYWIWIAYVFLIIVSIVAFIFEIFWHACNKRIKCKC